MAFNKKLLDIVACPLCKGQLILHDLKADQGNQDHEDTDNFSLSLVCRFDRLAFPIVDGIPVLLESESQVLSLEDLEKVKKHV